MGYNLFMNRQDFLNTFRRQFQPDPHKPLLVGVSGGADSLCLLHLLRDAGFELIPAHFDHLLRQVSGEQARQLREMLTGWGLNLRAGMQDVEAFARENKLGIEEAARICRYGFLLRQAELEGAQAVLTAHHRDDQVETVLMHFLRGSGVDGLSGMRAIEFLRQFSARIPVWRPLLDIPKDEILAYCQAQAIIPIEDESNAVNSFFRNRLRNEVIPYLESVQTGFSKTLARSAKALSLDRMLLGELSEQLFRQTALETIPGEAVLFRRERWQTLNRGEQARLLIRAAREVIPDLRDLGFDAVDRVLNGIEAGIARQDLRANLVVTVRDDLVAVAKSGFRLPNRELPQLPDEQPILLAAGGTALLANGWKLSASLIKKADYERASEKIKTSPMHAWLNPCDLEFPLIVRTPKPGERWSPLGLVMQRQKLSDFFVNQKVPRSARQKWPIVTSGGSILWVAGKRIAQAWRLLGDETQVLHLELIPPAAALLDE